MKKMIFVTGYIIISCWAQEYVDWRYLLLLGIVIIWLWYWYEATPPQEENPYKGRKVLEAFEQKISGHENDRNYIRRELERKHLRCLCHLRTGIRARISEWKISGMAPMFLREEKIIDEKINYYERLLELTNNRLPKKYRR